MKKLLGLMAAAALTASAGFVMAEGDTHQQKGAEQQQPKQGGQKQAAAQLKHHQVTGRIVDIDKDKGELKIETNQGQLEFDFPPASLQGYSEGDEVRLDVSIRPAPQKQQGGQQQKQPAQPQGQQPGGQQ